MRLLACQLPACLPVPCLAGCWLRGGGFEGEAPHRASERTGIGRASQPGFPPCLPADLCTSSGAFFLPLFILRKSTTTTIPLPEWRKRERETRRRIHRIAHMVKFSPPPPLDATDGSTLGSQAGSRAKVRTCARHAQRLGAPLEMRKRSAIHDCE